MKFENKTFAGETVEVDFNHFVKCTFSRCTLVYNGYGPFGLDGCTFDTVNWRFAGAAANTVAFLRGLYHGAGSGGRSLVENTFASIRSPTGEA